MANARKLPSGAYQTRATKVINGKKVTKSFTVHPDQMQGNAKKAKAQSEKMAREWQIETSNESIYSPSVGKCLQKYIDDNRKHLSPRTVYDYELYMKFFDNIKDICMDDLRAGDLQLLINEWSVTMKAKSIRNKMAFILSALDYAGCDRKFRLRYPENDSVQVGSPDVNDVLNLLANAEGDMKAIIALAALPGMRRGEIAALKEGDISRDMCSVFVHADMVFSSEGWIYKDRPKTKKSKRTFYLPKFVIDMLPVHDDPDDYVFGLNPSQITDRYDKIRLPLGIPHTLHSLRHFAVSFRSDLGINEKYIQEVVGHEIGSKVTERVYNNPIASTRKHYLDMTNKYIEDTFKNVLSS